MEIRKEGPKKIRSKQASDVLYLHHHEIDQKSFKLIFLVEIEVQSGMFIVVFVSLPPKNPRMNDFDFEIDILKFFTIYLFSFFLKYNQKKGLFEE